MADLTVKVRVSELGAIPTREAVDRAARSWLPRFWFYAAVIRVPKRWPAAMCLLVLAGWGRHRELEFPIGLKFVN